MKPGACVSRESDNGATHRVLDGLRGPEGPTSELRRERSEGDSMGEAAGAQVPEEADPGDRVHGAAARQHALHGHRAHHP